MPNKIEKSQDITVSRKEAALILGVSTDHVLKLAESGLLRRLGRPARFLEQEVKDLAQVRKYGRKSEAVAQQAFALARRLEKELAEIRMLLRLDGPKLPVEKPEVVQLLARVERLCVLGTVDAQEIDEWIRLLLAVDEVFLGLVSKLTAKEEVWLPFLEAAQIVFEHAQQEERNKADFMRRNMRNVCYFVVREEQGIRKANKLFPKGSFVETLTKDILTDHP